MNKFLFLSAFVGVHQQLQGGHRMPRMVSQVQVKTSKNLTASIFLYPNVEPSQLCIVQVVIISLYCAMGSFTSPISGKM